MLKFNCSFRETKFVGDILIQFMKFLKGITHCNEHIKLEINKLPIISKKEISIFIKTLIQKNLLAKEHIETLLKILFETICEFPVNILQPIGYLIKNQSFLEILLALLNNFHKFPEWRDVVKSYLNFFIATIKNSYVNYFICSNVFCFLFIFI